MKRGKHVLARSTRVKHTIYFVEAPAVGAIKIGITANFKRRLEALEAGSPTALVVLHTLRGTARQEGALHTKFLALRTHGEWFRAHDEIRDLIEMLRTSSEKEIGELFRRMRVRPFPRLRLRHNPKRQLAALRAIKNEDPQLYAYLVKNDEITRSLLALDGKDLSHASTVGLVDPECSVSLRSEPRTQTNAAKGLA